MIYKLSDLLLILGLAVATTATLSDGDDYCLTDFGDHFQPEHSGSANQINSTTLEKPSAFWADDLGNLIIFDSMTNQLFNISQDGHFNSLVAGTRAAGNDGDNGPATSASIVEVTRIWIDSSGNIFFAEPSTIRKISHQTKIIKTIAGGGSNFGDTHATSAYLYLMTGLTGDTQGSIYASVN